MVAVCSYTYETTGDRRKKGGGAGLVWGMGKVKNNAKKVRKIPL